MTEEPRQQRVDEHTGVTGIPAGADEAWPPVPVEPGTPPYVKEPLFSKKVLAGWAIGTLIVWFAITVVVPEIVRSVKAEIRAKMDEPGMNTPGERVIETPRGTVRIRRDASGTITIETTRPGAAPAPVVTVPAPPVGPAPPAPGAPAPSPTN